MVVPGNSTSKQDASTKQTSTIAERQNVWRKPQILSLLTSVLLLRSDALSHSLDPSVNDCDSLHMNVDNSDIPKRIRNIVWGQNSVHVVSTAASNASFHSAKFSIIFTLSEFTVLASNYNKPSIGGMPLFS